MRHAEFGGDQLHDHRTGTGSIVRNADGRLVMFSRGTNNALYQNIQATVGGSTWSGWTSLSGSLAGDPIAIRNADGRVQVFVFGTDGALWYKIQATPGSATWSTNYVGLGGNTLRKTSLVVQMNTDGRVELFGRGTNNAIWHRYQTTPGGSWNADWVSLNGQLAGDPTVILNPDGRLDVYARAFDGKIWHITQVSPSVSTTWSAWASLGSGSIASMGSRAESVTGRMHRRFRQENAG
ncbi:MAG: hypothetical protein AUI14_18525 [Actinobacteria bacterium 13_2_20CM_2_71_6]|nr:MAG: hypothetical protein AUI14_18525 [Actinobacteria bacterium 13_2_20CM_2_71_6]